MTLAVIVLTLGLLAVLLWAEAEKLLGEQQVETLKVHDMTDEEWEGWLDAERTRLAVPTLCTCTDCGRNQPLKNCPECGGKGELK